MNAQRGEDWPLLVGGQSFVRANVSGVTSCHEAVVMSQMSPALLTDTLVMDCLSLCLVISSDLFQRLKGWFGRYFIFFTIAQKHIILIQLIERHHDYNFIYNSNKYKIKYQNILCLKPSA